MLTREQHIFFTGAQWRAQCMSPSCEDIERAARAHYPGPAPSGTYWQFQNGRLQSRTFGTEWQPTCMIESADYAFVADLIRGRA